MGAGLDSVDHATIAAIATATGGGVGIIRVSGPRAISLADRFFRTKSSTRRHGQLCLGHFVANDGRVLDEGMVVVFRAPKSLTGEDVVEFHLHGGAHHLSECLEVLFVGGATAAAPGEFLQRAFLNDKIDLTKAESVADLIAAQTSQAATHARRHLQGGLREQLDELRDRIIRVRAALEVNIDFIEEDVPLMDPLPLAEELDEVGAVIHAMIDSYRYGRLLRDGANVVLAGAPNAGKSSLFNALYGSERAIVTARAGTTRDTLSETLNIGGVLTTLTDTAGVRESEDEVESIGIERAVRAAQDADLVLLVTAPDSTGRWPEDPFDLTGVAGPVLHVWSKADLVGSGARAPADGVVVSTRDAGSISRLKAVIAGHFLSAESERPLITRARQVDALTATLTELVHAAQSLRAFESPELAALDLQGALNALAEITGATTPDDILDRLFSTFCIGK